MTAKHLLRCLMGSLQPRLAHECSGAKANVHFMCSWHEPRATPLSFLLGTTAWFLLAFVWPTPVIVTTDCNILLQLLHVETALLRRTPHGPASKQSGTTRSRHLTAAGARCNSNHSSVTLTGRVLGGYLPISGLAVAVSYTGTCQQGRIGTDAIAATNGELDC